MVATGARRNIEQNVCSVGSTAPVCRWGSWHMDERLFMAKKASFPAQASVQDDVYHTQALGSKKAIGIAKIVQEPESQGSERLS